ncbi:MAG: MATE family efflux transporter [Candidatus Caenarcaniphilales bacterium]|jgi:MATE family multidrug resistance protein|nr:MATE family efflux transporter [Candidatus Caenarcaniphilales bacterium]
MIKSEVSYRRIWSLAWPIILTNITIPLIGATNVAVMGRLPSPIYIGAVSLGVLVLQCIYWSFAFLRKGTTGITAQAYGAKNTPEVCLALVRSLMIAFVLSVLVLILQVPICNLAFKILQASPEVERQAEIFFYIRIWATFPTLANYAMLGWFYGIQKPKKALWLRTLMNLVNIPLAIYLVLVLDTKTEGAAWSALISQIFVFVLSAVVAYTEIKKLNTNAHGIHNFDFIQEVFNKEKLVRIFKVNRDIFIRTVLVYLAFSWFTASSARTSDLVLAANTILINLFWFISYALDGFSNATEALVGEAVGAQNQKLFDEAISKSVKFSLVFALLLSLSFYFGKELILAAMTTHREIQKIALDYFLWLVFIPITGIWCFQADGIFVGMTKTSYMRNNMIISFAVYAIAIVFLPKFFANNGLWMALHIFMIMRGLTLWRDFGKAKNIIK